MSESHAALGIASSKQLLELPSYARADIIKRTKRNVGPAPQERFDSGELRFGGQLRFGMSSKHTIGMVESTIKRGGFAQKLGARAIQVPHIFEHVYAFRGVQDFVVHACALEPQVHQHKVDVI